MDNAGLTAKIKENGLTLLVLLVAIIIAVKVYQSKETEIQDLKKQKADEEQKNEVLGQIGSLENKLDNLKKNFVVKEPTTGMERIGDLAKSVSVQIVKINPVKETVSGVYTRYPFEMNLAAKDYHQIGKFISLLENSPDNYIVENLIINNSASGESNGITATVTVCIITINK